MVSRMWISPLKMVFNMSCGLSLQERLSIRLALELFSDVDAFYIADAARQPLLLLA